MSRDAATQSSPACPDCGREHGPSPVRQIRLWRWLASEVLGVPPGSLIARHARRTSDGTPAGHPSELRKRKKARMAAHDCFDGLWKHDAAAGCAESKPTCSCSGSWEYEGRGAYRKFDKPTCELLIARIKSMLMQPREGRDEPRRREHPIG